jgi:small GTP-binding protein
MANIYKIVFMGHYGVGKSSIVNNIMYGPSKFKDETYSTIGSHYFGYKLTDKIQIDFWDTAGQERYSTLLSIYYRSAELCILVFDMSNIKTLNRVENILTEVEQVNHNTKYIIVGNKCDLITEDERIKINNIVRQKFGTNEKILSFINTSAKTNFNMKEIMTIITEHLEYVNKIGKKKNVEIDNIVLLSPEKTENLYSKFWSFC